MKMYVYCEEDIKAIKHDLFELYSLCVPKHVSRSCFEPLIEDIFEHLHNSCTYDSVDGD